jgi:hypothetical protein
MKSDALWGDEETIRATKTNRMGMGKCSASQEGEISPYPG